MRISYGLLNRLSDIGNHTNIIRAFMYWRDGGIRRSGPVVHEGFIRNGMLTLHAADGKVLFATRVH